MKVQSFIIEGLFDEVFKINIKDNKLIIVADNGSGKTTILRLLYFFLTKQWAKIIEYEFDKIIATINDKEYIFKRKEFKANKISKKIYNNLAKKYSNYSSFINNVFLKYNLNDLKSNLYMIDEIEQDYDVPKNLILSLIDELELKKFDDSVFDWEINVIYLPTYRRIEKDYFSIYGDIDKRVSNYILTLYPEIRNIIIKEKSQNNSDFSETEEDLNKIFTKIISSRNNEKWLKNKTIVDKLEMIEFGMTDVNFRLKEFYQLNLDKKNELIVSFIELINRYFNKEKTLFFDDQYCELFLKNNNKNIITNLHDLSSGEKQLISLFSHLFFDDKKSFVIVDEPEISLSIAWQEMILNDIINHSIGTIVATHSPFIVNNLLRENTCGIKEFLINE
ncbi:ATP-binding protein [Flavobacterium jejuense]|uniref:ATP-binding protein n=1 Tax=Flavobacterium jejuense TaxID=1544455 RepID=A0ABX0IRU1_9FLAO|nr:AAA family ATPase [Flavobacterium jejuense]NHN24555.1 ATP-binding protein [Flavobacterium jejuense]